MVPHLFERELVIVLEIPFECGHHQPTVCQILYSRELPALAVQLLLKQARPELQSPDIRKGAILIDHDHGKVLTASNACDQQFVHFVPFGLHCGYYKGRSVGIDLFNSQLALAVSVHLVDVDGLVNHGQE